MGNPLKKKVGHPPGIRKKEAKNGKTGFHQSPIPKKIKDSGLPINPGIFKNISQITEIRLRFLQGDMVPDFVKGCASGIRPNKNNFFILRFLLQ